jgi:putative endonuclease
MGNRPTDQRNRSRGRWGEDLAATHYERNGCTVIDRNWRSKTGELDLIVRDGDVYVFSEVKARRSDRYGPAAAAVGPDKQHRIRRLAIEWLRAHDLHHVDIRFDVVAITGTRLTLIESAF